jgi:hypothetical protein
MIGLPGETVREDDHGFDWIRGPNSKTWVKLKEPYLTSQRRLADTANFGRAWKVPLGEYFLAASPELEARTESSAYARSYKAALAALAELAEISLRRAVRSTPAAAGIRD